MIRANPVKLKGAAKEKIHLRPEVTFKDVVRLAEVVEPQFSALVWAAATSGLRFGELTALRRSDVDPETGQLRVLRSLAFVKGVGPVFGPPKTESGERMVSLDSTTIEILRKHMDSFTDEPRAMHWSFDRSKAAPCSTATSIRHGPERNATPTSTQRSASTTFATSPARRPRAPAPRRRRSWRASVTRLPTRHSATSRRRKRAMPRSLPAWVIESQGSCCSWRPDVVSNEPPRCWTSTDGLQLIGSMR